MQIKTAKIISYVFKKVKKGKICNFTGYKDHINKK